MWKFEGNYREVCALVLPTRSCAREIAFWPKPSAAALWPTRHSSLLACPPPPPPVISLVIFETASRSLVLLVVRPVRLPLLVLAVSLLTSLPRPTSSALCALDSFDREARAGGDQLPPLLRPASLRKDTTQTRLHQQRKKKQRPEDEKNTGWPEDHSGTESATPSSSHPPTVHPSTMKMPSSFFSSWSSSSKMLLLLLLLLPHSVIKAEVAPVDPEQVTRHLPFNEVS